MFFPYSRRISHEFFCEQKNLGNRGSAGQYFHFKRNGKYNKHQRFVALPKNGKIMKEFRFPM
jgi:hypothetical protein